MEFIRYPVYINLSYFWNFGVLSFLFLIIQIITGIFLAMHYVATPEMAFMSVEHIMRDVNYGWLIRYMHSNGASFFFICVYIHFFRSIYYNSYTSPRELVWVIGVLILLVMVLTAFLGYVLPWGQMSFWAATVITSLFSAIPVFGESVVVWLWGGYAVDSATLTRFFSLHYLFPFILLFLVILHILFLHENGSTNPMGISLKLDKIPFSPYYIWKDLLGILFFFFIFFIFVFFFPNLLGHTDNYIQANPLVTPTHIVPEWYFLPFYAILRSIPNKLGGIIVLFLVMFVLFVLPYLGAYVGFVRGKNFFYLNKFFFWLFVVCCFLLGWLGGEPVEYPYLDLGEFLTFYFFYHLCLITNIIGELNRLLVFENIDVIRMKLPKWVFKTTTYFQEDLGIIQDKCSLVTGFIFITIKGFLDDVYECSKFYFLQFIGGINNIYWYNPIIRVLMYPFLIVEIRMFKTFNRIRYNTPRRLYKLYLFFYMWWVPKSRKKLTKKRDKIRKFEVILPYVRTQRYIIAQLQAIGRRK